MFQFWRRSNWKPTKQRVRRGSLSAFKLETLEDRVNPVLFYTADLALVLSHSPASMVPGQNASFVLTVSNSGPNAVSSLNLIDRPPASLQNVTYTPSTGAYSSVTGNWNLPSPLAAGSSITLTVSGTVAPNATAPLVNSALVSAPPGVCDPNPLNNAPPPDILRLAPGGDLSVTKTDSANNHTVVAGNPVTFTITVSNGGPNTATGATVTDNIPAGFDPATATWTAVTTGGATATASGTGSINQAVTLPANSSVTYTLIARALGTTSGQVVNTATVTAPNGFTDTNPNNNSASDTVTVQGTGDLTITKTDNLANHTVVDGGQVVYTIVVGNGGPGAVTNATVGDLIPAGLINATWTAVASGGASVGSTSGTDKINTTVSLLPTPSSIVTFTLTATASAAATSSGLGGQVDNTAIVTAPAGFVDSNPGNNSATDSIQILPIADLSITKTDNTGGASAGGATVVYTIVVTNNGPAPVTAAPVVDQFRPELINVTWTATPGANASVAQATGTGNINTTVNLASGASVTFTVTATIDPAAVNPGDVVANSASVQAPQDRFDPNTNNNLAVDTINIQPGGDLSVTKTSDAGNNPVTPGSPVVYTVTVTNTGSAAVVNASFTDPVPTGLTAFTSWAEKDSAGKVITTGSGAISELVSIAANDFVTFTVSASTDANATGPANNVATIAAPAGFTDTNPANNSATASVFLQGTSDLATTTADDTGGVSMAGAAVTYTLRVTNNGPSAVAGAAVTDVFPAELQNVAWTEKDSAGNVITTGTGDVNTAVDLAAGAFVTFTVTATVDPNAPADATVVVNGVTVAAPVGRADPDPLNNTSTSFFTLTPRGDLSVNIANNTNGGPITAGTPIVYTITVTNTGVDPVVDATLMDAIPTGVLDFTWTATAPAGSTVPASGTGAIDALMSLLPGNSAIFSVTATTDPAFAGQVNNSAGVTPPVDFTDINPGNNSASNSVTLTP